MVRCAPSIASLSHQRVSRSSHSQKPLRATGPGMLLPLTSERWCEGLSTSRKAQYLLSSKKGTYSTRHGAAGQNTKQNHSSSVWWQQNRSQAGAHMQPPKSICVAKASGRQALPFPPPSGTARPVTSVTPLCSTASLSGPADIHREEGLPQGWDAPYPDTTSGSHREQELPTPGGGGCGFRIRLWSSEQ